MSGKTKTQPAVQLAPQVNLAESNPETFLIELQRLVIAGYRLDLEQMNTMFPGCYIATLRLPEAATA